MRFEPRKKHSEAGSELTRSILATFRLNGALVQAGDALLRDLGVSSARWQVMGTIDLGPLPVSQIARDLGLKRQGVQPTVNRLEKQGLVEFRVNPSHRRSQHVALTRKGRSVLDEINMRQQEWVNALAEGLSARTLKQLTSLSERIRQRLETEQAK